MNNFIYNNNEELVINYKFKPNINDILKKQNFTTPLMIRFPHILKKQIDSLFNAFNSNIKKLNYKGNFSAVYPLKVNSSSSVLNIIENITKTKNYGIEVGSKTELLIALNINNKNKKIIINGFKDKDFLEMAFIAKNSGFNIFILLENIYEIDIIIKLKKFFNLIPDIGIRLKISKINSGKWKDSTGEESKFGLNSNEILYIINKMKKHSIIYLFKILHFHIGTEMNNINNMKNTLIEVCALYKSLKDINCYNLENIDIGGGISTSNCNINSNYNIEEYSFQILNILKNYCDKYKIKHPNIISESGKYITQSHSIIITNVIKNFNKDNTFKIKKIFSSFTKEIENFLSKNIKNISFKDIEFYIKKNNDLFNNSLIGLEEKVYVYELLHNFLINNYKKTNQFLINLSIFQSIPDQLIVKEDFKILPIHYKKIKNYKCKLFDLTCDSDGIKILENCNFKIEENDNIVILNTGAYQENLNMKHNLFSKINEIIVEINDDNMNLIKYNGENILETFESLKYKEKKGIIKNEFLNKFYFIIKNNNYLN